MQERRASFQSSNPCRGEKLERLEVREKLAKPALPLPVKVNGSFGLS
jgi:hypothetical protein